MIWGIEGIHLWVPAFPDTQLLRTNLATNPRLGTNATNWGLVGGGTAARNTGVPVTPSGNTTAWQVIITQSRLTQEGSLAFPVTNGKTYRISWARLTVVRDAGTQVDVRLCDGSGTQKAISPGVAAAPGSTWLREGFVFTADSTGTWTMRIGMPDPIGMSDSFTENLTEALLEEGGAPFGTYFDGAHMPSDADPILDAVAWTGVADASTSTLTHSFSNAEVAHKYVNGDYPFGAPLALNQRLDTLGNPLLPVFKVEAIDGLAGSGDSGDRRDVRVGAQGEIPRRSYRRGKTITYEGRTLAPTRAALRDAEAQLVRAFDDQSDEGLVIVRPHKLYDPGVHFRYFPARALTCEISDAATFSPGRRTGGHESPFVIALRNARAGGVSYFDQNDDPYP